MSKADCQKRNSKLESHLKRTLPRHVYDDIRYYESCIVKLPNEALAYQYVILTGNAVLLASYPFRGVKEAVRLYDVLSINVELDCPSFLKVSDAHNYQHIRLNYQRNISETNNINLRMVKEEQEEVEDINSIHSSLKSTQFSETEKFVEESLNKSLSYETKHNSLIVDSFERNCEELMETDPLISSTTEAIIQEKGGFLTSQKRRSQQYHSQTPLLRGEVPYRDVIIPMNFDTSRESIKYEWSKEQISGRKLRSPQGNMNSILMRTSRSQTNTPEPQERSISSLLRRVVNSQPRSSRSYSSMTHYAKTASSISDAANEKRSQSVMERPRRTLSAKSSESSVINSFHSFDDIHLYVMQPKPVLLNHLQSSWCTILLNRTLEVTKPTIWLNEDIDIFQMENSYNKLKYSILNPENNSERVHSLLNELSIRFQRRTQLKHIFWKDQMLYYYILQKLEYYMHSSQNSSSLSACDGDIYIQARGDELRLTITLLDIMFNVLHDTDKIHEKMKMFNFRNGCLMKQLLAILISPPHISSKFQIACCRMLEDYNEFSTYAWKNLPEGVLIDLLGTITNQIGRILSELMTTIKRLADNNSGINLSLLFTDLTMKNYLKRCVTQLLTLLYPSELKGLGPEDSVLLYHHFNVLKCLMEDLPHVLNYVKEHYQEELRYYITWARINYKIPDKYPVKQIIRPLVEYVHECGSSEQSDKMPQRIS